MSDLRRRLPALSAWLHRPRPAPRPPRLARLLRRTNCGLCDEALALLRPYIQAGRLRLREVDIERDPALLQRYFFSIPVLTIDDGPTLSWPFDQHDLRRALA